MNDDYYFRCDGESVMCDLSRRQRIGKGWLHAFTTQLEAQLVVSKSEEFGCGKYCYFTMIIPKGAKYILSHDEKEIATDTLIW